MEGYHHYDYDDPYVHRPQQVFNIFVNNANEHFKHVWLEWNSYANRYIHPLEKLSAFDFLDQNAVSIVPVEPLPTELTPFTLVEEVDDLKQLAAKLRCVNEFAVDLEHNQYRSFQGLTCLMQISTRTEDFVVDTLKLRIYIGPYLREVFKDPSKKKVMHGAGNDIKWLQRDFGIYVCNMFDTQQASRVLKLDKNGLGYLLHYFCGVSVNKDYQKSDWRLRPLPEDMIKYAREDTHYLLYVYDLMRGRLFSKSMSAKGGDNLLLEVYRLSYDVSILLYEKDLITSSSYLNVYGLKEDISNDFNAYQLSVVAGLYEWRDIVARAEDESTGYIMPNKLLLDIARNMPLTVGRLRYLLNSYHPYVEVNLEAIVEIIKNSMQNAAAFEFTAGMLKKVRQNTVKEFKRKLVSTEHFPASVCVSEEKVVQHNIERASAVFSQQVTLGEGEIVNRMIVQSAKYSSDSVRAKGKYSKLEKRAAGCSSSRESSFQTYGEVEEVNKEQNVYMQHLRTASFTNAGQIRDTHTNKDKSDLAEDFAGSTEEPSSRVIGLGSSNSKAESDTDPKDKEKQIKSSVMLSSKSSNSNNEQLRPLGRNKNSEFSSPKCISSLEDIASFRSHLANQEPPHDFTEALNDFVHRKDAGTEGLDARVGKKTLSSLSSEFPKYIQLKHEKENNNTRPTMGAPEQDCVSPLRSSSGYSATMEQMRARQGQKEVLTRGDEGFKILLSSIGGCNSSIISRFRKDEVTKDFQQAKQYQVSLCARNDSFT